MGKYQTVTIKFSNGKEGIFTGKAVITKEDEKNGITAILPVLITEPKDLPESVGFGKLDDNAEQ